MITVLCVDDQKHITDVLSRYLTKWGYLVLVASDGETGWDIIQKNRPEIVLTDWLMPDLEGPDLCRRVRSAGFPGYTYMILLTAKSDKEDLVLGMEAGADDFISKPFEIGELKVRLNAAARMVRLERQLTQANSELDEKNLALNEMYDSVKIDLEAAAQIQLTLLPDRNVSLPGFHFDWLFSPSTFIAGDIFNIFPVDSNHLNFYLIDVSGHGIPAALLSTTLSRVLSPQSHFTINGPLGQTYCDTCENRQDLIVSLNSPAHVALALNKQFMSDGEQMQYFTMLYGSVDLRDGTTTITQAGHPSPVYQAPGGEVRTIGGGGFPIGLIPEADFEDVSFRFEAGGRLYLYSDGITECRGATGTMFGEKALLDVLRAGWNQPLREVIDRLRSELAVHRGSDSFDDDLSLLAIERMEDRI